jgi:hypothetical protein
MRAAAGDNTPLYEYTVMPTHMASRFTPEELQAWEVSPGFSFTKGCPVMKIAGRGSHVAFTAHEQGHLLYDLQRDPAQASPFADTEAETMMIGHLVRLMQENEAPPEQFERLGLVDQAVAA